MKVPCDTVITSSLMQEFLRVVVSKQIGILNLIFTNHEEITHLKAMKLY